MKQKLLLLICLFAMSDLTANVNHIDLTKITNDPSRVALFQFVKENERYYSHWTPQWNYDKEKPELDLNLQEAFRSFASLPSKNAETFLLLGDIAHYLYNLDVTIFNDSAIVNYNRAMKISPKDFRSYWFLGFHYAQSMVTKKGLDDFFQAQQLLPSPEPADFWNEYAWVAAIANMPTHSIFAMDKVRALAGKSGSTEDQLGDVIRKRIVAVDRDSTYKREKIWYATKGEKTTFTSRPLGVKVAVDSTWDLDIFDYQKRFGAFVLKPPILKNKAGREIHYTIALLMMTVDDGDQLDDFVKRFTAPTGEKKKVNFSNKYDKMITYEIIDKSMYPDIGGGHLYVIGVERNAPKYPGLLLEDPFSFPHGKSNGVTYVTPQDSKNRFRGKIFYGIMLDTCEDIHKESLAVFKEVFEKQIVIE
jgi:hypothetical protein